MQNAANKRSAARRASTKAKIDRQEGAGNRQTKRQRERERRAGKGQRQRQRQDVKIIKHTRKYDNARFLLKLLPSETWQKKQGKNCMHTHYHTHTHRNTDVAAVCVADQRAEHFQLILTAQIKLPH